jgi:hypothetical protein
MRDLLRGRVPAGKGDASQWLYFFNATYSRKLQMPVSPGVLNRALEDPLTGSPHGTKRTSSLVRAWSSGGREPRDRVIEVRAHGYSKEGEAVLI